MADSIDAQVFSSTPQNTNPSMSVNFIRNTLEEINVKGFLTNSTTITLEIILLNYEPQNVLIFFNLSSAFITNCAKTVVDMYPLDHLKKINVITNPEVSVTFNRTPKGYGGDIKVTGVDAYNLSSRYFLSNIKIQISECEINRIQQSFAAAAASIVAQINEAVALYNTNPIYPG